MNRLFRLVTAFAAGAAAMYYLDPVAGRRRRALVRDRGIATRHDVEDFARAKSKRAGDRMRGMVARSRSRMSDEAVDDDQLHQRIRARLGHVIEHAGEINVDVNDGHVVLRGIAAPHEIDEVVSTISSMRGVEGIDNRLSASQPGGAPRH